MGPLKRVSLGVGFCVFIPKWDQFFIVSCVFFCVFILAVMSLENSAISQYQFHQLPWETCLRMTLCVSNEVLNSSHLLAVKVSTSAF